MKYATPTSLKALKELAASIKSESTKFSRTLAALNVEVGKKKEAVAQVLAQTSADRRKAAQAHYDAEHAEWMKAYRVQTAPARSEIVSSLAAGAAVIKFAKEQLADPRRVATGFMLGSEERFRLETSLEKIGTASLGALAEKARAERHTPEGKLLASVVAMANDRMPRNSRVVDSITLCEAVFGEECKQVADLCKFIEREATVAYLLDGEFNGRAITATERVALGLTHGGDPLNESAPAPKEEQSEGFKALSDFAKQSAASTAAFDKQWAGDMAKLDALAT